MTSRVMRTLVLGLLTTLASASTMGSPPLLGTIAMDPDIITPEDPTTLSCVSYAGRGVRDAYDRRVGGWIRMEAYLFDAAFDDGSSVQIQVNPEFRSEVAALALAEAYGRILGQLPAVLRSGVRRVFVHRGRLPFAGGHDFVLIHTDQGEEYERDGILEETLVHEASHTSLDPLCAGAQGWRAAQKADGEYISTYARDFPSREDVAESFLPYLAIRYRRDRISSELAALIVSTIPHRIDYFDGRCFDVHPWDTP